MKSIKYFLSALCILFLCLPFCRAADGEETLGRIPGADMTVYDMYRRTENRDREKSAAYAELFLKGIDTSCYIYPELALMCGQVSDYYGKRHLYTEAVSWRDRELMVYERLGDRRMSAVSGYHLAELYQSLGRYHDALRYVNEAYPVFEEYGEEGYLADSWNLLGAIYFMCHDYEGADEWFRKYARKAIELEDSTRIAVALGNLSAYSYAAGDTLRAVTLQKDAIDMSIAVSDTSLIARNYLNMAALSINMERYDDARHYLSEARPYLSDTEKEGHYYLNLYVLSRAEGDTDAALSYLRMAIESYGKGEFDRDLLDCYVRLVGILDEEGKESERNEAAYEYFKISERLSAEDVSLRLFGYQNEIIKNKDIEKEMEKKAQRNYFILTGASLIIILSLCAMLYAMKNASAMRRKDNELRRQQLINEEIGNEVRSKNEVLEIKKVEQYKTERLIDDIVSGLNSIRQDIKDAGAREKLLHMIKDVEFSRETHRIGDELGKYVPVFNSEFFRKLLSDYPNLTNNERRLCALISVNLSTKEISEITRQSIHSINMARSRLRNKFKLTGTAVSIQEFLSKYN